MRGACVQVGPTLDVLKQLDAIEITFVKVLQVHAAGGREDEGEREETDETAWGVGRRGAAAHGHWKGRRQSAQARGRGRQRGRARPREQVEEAAAGL